jgi:NAD(P)-dependent dehydrogenase (short-subunit alcohol dehydrogenase family)
MSTILITGANRGIGLELTRIYAAEGHTVIATARDPDKADDLKAVKGDVQIHALDVRDRPAIVDLASQVPGPHIVIANAGIFGPRRGDPGQTLGQLDYPAWAEVFDVNVLGAMATLEAFLPALRSNKGKAVAITSLMGSIGDASGGFYAYRSSKAALNMAVQAFAHDVARDQIAVGLLHPGWVETDMGGAGAPVSPADSAKGLRRVIESLQPSGSAPFLNFRGESLPW